MTSAGLPGLPPAFTTRRKLGESESQAQTSETPYKEPLTAYPRIAISYPFQPFSSSLFLSKPRLLGPGLHAGKFGGPEPPIAGLRQKLLGPRAQGFGPRARTLGLSGLLGF